jgi:hypothetical protein
LCGDDPSHSVCRGRYVDYRVRWRGPPRDRRRPDVFALVVVRDGGGGVRRVVVRDLGRLVDRRVLVRRAAHIGARRADVWRCGRRDAADDADARYGCRRALDAPRCGGGPVQQRRPERRWRWWRWRERRTRIMQCLRQRNVQRRQLLGQLRVPPGDMRMPWGIVEHRRIYGLPRLPELASAAFRGVRLPAVVGTHHSLVDSCTSLLGTRASRVDPCTSLLGTRTSRVDSCTSLLGTRTSRVDSCPSSLRTCTSRVDSYPAWFDTPAVDLIGGTRPRAVCRGRDGGRALPQRRGRAARESQRAPGTRRRRMAGQPAARRRR